MLTIEARFCLTCVQGSTRSYPKFLWNIIAKNKFSLAIDMKRPHWSKGHASKYHMNMEKYQKRTFKIKTNWKKPTRKKSIFKPAIVCNFCVLQYKFRFKINWLFIELENLIRFPFKPIGLEHSRISYYAAYIPFHIENCSWNSFSRLWFSRFFRALNCSSFAEVPFAPNRLLPVFFPWNWFLGPLKV